MIITIEQLIPLPLKDRLEKRQSQIWKNTIRFNSHDYTKIIAPSGTGKTTFIHLLYGLRKDYTGKILYNDIDLNSIDINTISTYRQTKISVVFQDLQLFENLTAKENIELKRTMQTPFYESNVIDEMAEMLGITHILQQQVSTCSYGEQQRIAIIRALMQPFEMLLLDEPFSHLDNKNTKKAASLIATECKKRNAGFVLTDLDEDKNFDYTRVLSL